MLIPGDIYLQPNDIDAALSPLRHGTLTGVIKVCGVSLSAHAGAVQCLCQADHGEDPESYRESLSPSVLHLCSVLPQSGWHSFHRGRIRPHSLHRRFPQVGFYFSFTI